jgi:hypothetical protein
VAKHFELYVASDHGYNSNDLIRLPAVFLDRHVVRQLGYALLREKPRKQDVCVRQTKLTYPHVVNLGSNFESTAALIIVERGKHCRRVELRVAQKIDRAVYALQRNGLHVSDHAIILDGFKGHLILVIKQK